MKNIIIALCMISGYANHIEITHQLNEETEVINQGLSDFNTPFFGRQKEIDFAVLLKDEEGKTVGGVLVWMRPGLGLMYIDTIWLPEQLRKKGFGTQLMLAAEAEGKKHGCTHSQVDTLPFQAEPFYQKLGYYRIGVVEKLFGDHDYIFMRKDLNRG
jgi:GNAT superfamily N-acetyltransferase